METGARGASVIVRDSQGILVEALAMWASSKISVLATELYDLKIRISFALDASLVPLEIESDSLQVVSMVNSLEECLAAEGGLVEGVCRLLASSAFITVKYIPRQANKATIELLASVFMIKVCRAGWIWVLCGSWMLFLMIGLLLMSLFKYSSVNWDVWHSFSSPEVLSYWVFSREVLTKPLYPCRHTFVMFM
ncbi:hypothetical protein L3X38_011789 [Prunus dulcis]|uniref:RNase H type-1 domain-containing protein n=1 Tax=Prunus dulcis TaxID=3755 RepID=A0AAD4ZG13_PRUDU|nr:hypothetical protein L3X38_011789 [Prunus dulcis]